MRLEKFINEEMLIENIILKNIKKLFTKPARSVLVTLQNSFKKFMDYIVQQDKEKDIVDILNKFSEKKYTSLEQAYKARPITEEKLNEDWAHFWEVIKGEAFPSLAFYPMLQVFMEIDKLIKGTDASFKIIVVYSVLWFFLISGKFIKQFNKWKKENPEEYYAERPKLKKKLNMA